MKSVLLFVAFVTTTLLCAASALLLVGWALEFWAILSYEMRMCVTGIVLTVGTVGSTLTAYRLLNAFDASLAVNKKHQRTK